MRSIITARLQPFVLPALALIAAACADAYPTSQQVAAATEPSQTGPAAYVLTLSTLALSSERGSSSASMMLNVVRTNFAGDVTFSVENLPPGVSASIYPYGPNGSSVGNTWQVSMEVAADAPLGTFTNVLVRGVAAGLADRTAPLTLTIEERSVVLTLSSSYATIEQGAAAPVTTVSVLRTNFDGAVTLYVDIGNYHGNLPDGVTADFTPSETTGNSSVLTLAAGSTTRPGVYDLVVWGSIGSSDGAAAKYLVGVPLTLTITRREERPHAEASPRRGPALNVPDRR